MLMHPITNHKILWFVVILITACLNATTPDKSTNSQPATRKQAPKTFVYECSNAFNFVARIDDDTAWLFLPTGTVSLPREHADIGTRFSDNQILFWIRADKTLLEYNGTTYHNCINNRKAAIWEHAKLKGVDFRAVGNEPGWYLEIRNGDKILFISEYGASRYDFVAPEPSTDQQRRMTIYQTEAGANHLTVVIEGRQCRDTMSGEYFETAVTVNLDQKEYRGCGRALH